MIGTKRYQILVVEDDRPTAEVLCSRLGAAGFDVHAEENGAAALSYAAEHRPDLVILDVMLPDVHGHQVSRELRQLYNRWDVPILMLTAMDKPIDELRGFAHGADAYLTKPYDATELIKTVGLLLGQVERPD